MSIEWKLEIIEVKNGVEGQKDFERFQALTIGKAKALADDMTTEIVPPLSGEVADFDWMLDERRNRIVKVYFPQRIRWVREGIEILHLPQWYVTLEPDILLSDIRDYTETQ